MTEVEMMAEIHRLHEVIGMLFGVLGSGIVYLGGLGFFDRGSP